MSAAKLVIMDEPTAALGVAQTRTVLDLIKRLSSQGTAVLVVSHNLNDVFAVADQISILYLGRLVAQGPASDFDPQVVVDYMTTGQSTRAAAAGATAHDRHDRRARRAGREPEGDVEAGHAEPSSASTTSSSSPWPRTSWRTRWATTSRPGGSASVAARAARCPIIAGLIVICIFFEVQSSAFLTATNIVNLFVQAAFIILLGLAELYALILSEIDLSVGFVGAVGAAIALALMGSPPELALVGGAHRGPGRLRRHRRLPGHLITRLRIPSFVVTLAGLLGWQGVLIYVFDVDKGAVGGVITISNSVIDDLVSGNMTPAAGWIVLVVGVGLFALTLRPPHRAAAVAGPERAPDEHHAAHRRRRRRRGHRAGLHLQPQPRRAHAGQGRPWVIPFLVIIVAASPSCWPGPGSAGTSTPSAPAPRPPAAPASTWRGSAPSRSHSAASPPDWP